MTDWLEIHRGAAPLIVSMPHTGTEIPDACAAGLTSPWLARKDADWWIDRLYDFAGALGATTIRTRICRTVIDVNRDPTGASLYPGQTTTALCPTTTFDGEPLYRQGLGPDAAEIDRRRTWYFWPYHEALSSEIARLRAQHDRIVLYEAHSIRSVIPRLFEGELANFNIGANGSQSCAPELIAAVERVCDGSGFSRVTDGRFKGGWTTRQYGAPKAGVHAVQMELACRGYMTEPVAGPTPETWPVAYDSETAAPMRAVLTQILHGCLAFAQRK